MKPIDYYSYRLCGIPVVDILSDVKPISHYIKHPQDIPRGNTPVELYKYYLIFEDIYLNHRSFWNRDKYIAFLKSFSKDELINFLESLRKEDRNNLLLNRVSCWLEVGIDEYILEVLDEMLKEDDQQK